MRHKTWKEEHISIARKIRHIITFVGFVAAAVSMPMGGCRAISFVSSSLPVVVVDVPVAAEPAVL